MSHRVITDKRANKPPVIWKYDHTSVSQFSSVAQSCPTLCDPIGGRKCFESLGGRGLPFGSGRQLRLLGREGCAEMFQVNNSTEGLYFWQRKKKTKMKEHKHMARSGCY